MEFPDRNWFVKFAVFINDERKYLFWVGFITTVYGANWSLVKFGFVPIGFGFTAPAGVYFAGLAFSLRDLLHENGGRWWILSSFSGSSSSEDSSKFSTSSSFSLRKL